MKVTKFQNKRRLEIQSETKFNLYGDIDILLKLGY